MEYITSKICFVIRGDSCGTCWRCQALEAKYQAAALTAERDALREAARFLIYGAEFEGDISAVDTADLEALVTLLREK